MVAILNSTFLSFVYIYLQELLDVLTKFQELDSTARRISESEKGNFITMECES